jgi:hypothetical protein
MKVFKKVIYFALGFVVASLMISLTSVGAEVSQEFSKVFITNKFKNPIPIVSKETLKIEGDVKIEGNPKVKLDDDTKIKIESVEKPVNVRFEKGEKMPQTEIFKSGKIYRISFDGKISGRCNLDKINGTWIYCENKGIEGEIFGWVNTAQIMLVSEL